MITLYHFGPYDGMPDASPFCVKVDLYLRMCGIEYKADANLQHLRKAPKGKLPFIEDDGKIIADSAFIIDYLKQKYGDSLDQHLSTEQRAVAHAFIRMLDEHTYWCMLHARWIDDEVWPILKKSLFKSLRFPGSVILPAVIRANQKKSLKLQGTGRHSAEEIITIAGKDLQALSDLLGDKDYFFGDKPTTLDVDAFAFLGQMTVSSIDSRLNQTARAFNNLVMFVERIRGKYYPELIG